MMEMDRRNFLKLSLAAGAAGMVQPPWRAQHAGAFGVVDDFSRSDAYYHGDGWESLNPGFWRIEDNALRRRLEHRGNRLSANWRWFPWHWETHRDQPMPVDYDPSLPFGMIFRRDWRLSGSYTIQIDATVLERPDRAGEPFDWKNHTPGYALLGVAFGSKCLHEGWTIGQVRGGEPGHPAWMACWRDDGRFGLYDHGTDAPEVVRRSAEKKAPLLEAGDEVTVEVDVVARSDGKADVRATLRTPDAALTVNVGAASRADITDGYFGLVGRGLLDFAVKEVRLQPGNNQRLHAPINDLHVSYALGDTLRKEDGRWRCRFLALFRSSGEEAVLRIADSPDPAGGWENVPAAGRANIVTNDFRRRTAVIEATLPANPAETTLYYTVLKDGRDVTADPRIGTDSVGEGTGFIGEVPSDGRYVGRLPQLTAPYRLCGLSCHAITANNPDLPEAGKYQAWWLHDQPTPAAYEHLEDYDFQVMVWEDDVWYLEFIFPPPSVDDAYKVITATLAGPTTRWQMMRHWNVINPGDHDHGMDDVKGPEQFIIRSEEGLGQDPEYMRRNFQIVSHLISGDEQPSATDNPRRWRCWKMPNGDFSLLVLDSRMWRTSQDTNIWDDEGWGHRESLYSRTDPTRALLGEEQFAWLHERIRTDAAPLMAVTGINGLHTVWSGSQTDPETGQQFAERDRVAADYAGWVKAGADRLLELLGSRQGVVSVYGDVHLGCIMENLEHGVIESCFGAISRWGSRAVKPDFGSLMKDYDGRELAVHALYHQKYQSPELEPIEGPKYWNFLEMVFDPRGKNPHFELKLRNLIDAPEQGMRGGGAVRRSASETGRPAASRLPAVTLLAEADVLITTTDGKPLRGTRSLPDGTLPLEGLIGVGPDTPVVLIARRDEQVAAEMVRTLPV